MIEINLLPSGAGRRPAAAAARKSPGGPSLPSLGADPRIAGLGAVALLLLVGGGFWFWNSGQQRDELATRIEEQAADSVRLDRAIELMRTLDTRRDTIDQKMDVIRQVDTRRYVWPHVMDEVSRATPPFMWLTKIAAIDDDGTAGAPPPAAAPGDSAAAAAPPAAGGPTFSVEGNAGSTEALTRFMRNLEASPMIRDVSLVTSQQETVQGRAVLKFTVEARWEDPDPTFIETVPLLTSR